MFCPQCGKRQTSNDVRFCTKCGLPLENASVLLATGGSAMMTTAASQKRQLSPRAKGILQGIALIPTLFGVMLVLDIFYETFLNAGMLGGLYSAITLIVLAGVGRIAHAVFVEEGNPKPPAGPAAVMPNQIQAGAETSRFTARDEMAAVEGQATAEMLKPGSITENTTTRLGTIE